MKKIGYWITYGLVFSWMYLHALLPLRVLYILSDILYVLVYKIVGYRKKVVKMNLKNSFPDKTDAELLKLEKDFYHHFCDYFVETIKLLHISDEEAQRRMVFENVDEVKRVMEGGKSALLYLGHYCNWEWVPSINLQFTEEHTLGQIYKPLKNKAIDDLFLKIRSRFGSIGIAKNDTLRTIITMKRAQKSILIGFMSDQTPSISNIHYWTNFLNQDTPVFIGVERIAKQTGFAIAYLDMKKVKRGHYHGTFSIVSENPQEEPEFAITERYARLMEKSILQNPAYWLWTHKRWKWTREKVEALQHHK